MTSPTTPQSPPPTPAPQSQLPDRVFTPPTPGEAITAAITGNTYFIGKPIGAGHFGDVFECRDVWDNSLAVKVLRPRGTYEAVRDAAISEVNKLLALRHPHITFMYDAFEFRDTFYIVTERCEWDLKALFGVQGFVGSVWVKPIARCLLQAVHYLHINGYAHQDIHPGNVFAAYPRSEMGALPPNLPQPMTFKLGDLGVAQLAAEVSLGNVRAQWMLPPEVVDPKEFGQPSPNTDIYHLGLLFLQLALSKEQQFSQEEVLAGRPRELAETLPAPFNFALAKALRRHVVYRTATALEFWRDLALSASGSLATDTGDHPVAK